MKNVHVNARTAKDIDDRIDRIHRDIDYAGGKVALLDVRELLRLDLQYYRTDDPRLLDEVIHKLKVGAKQVLSRPTLLMDVVKKFDLSALFIPDRKRILMDDSVPDLKKRWCESHEVAHSVIPWHVDYMLGDNRTTLSQDCHHQIESEANHGAARLLFPHKAFSDAWRSSAPTLVNVRSLAKHFGNTITSTLWRYIEQSEEASFAAIGEHPHHPREGKPPVEYFVRSNLFEQQFSKVGIADVETWIHTCCGYKRTGPIEASEIVIINNDDEPQIFLVEFFGNGYNLLTLARRVRASSVVVSVPSGLADIPDGML